MFKYLFVAVYGAACLCGGLYADNYLHTHNPRRTAGWALIECNQLAGAGYVYSDGSVVALDPEALHQRYNSFQEFAKDFGTIPEAHQYIMNSCTAVNTKTEKPRLSGAEF